MEGEDGKASRHKEARTVGACAGGAAHADHGQAQVVRARKGRNLLEKGSRSAERFFLLAGRAQVVPFSSTGREVSIHTIGPGGMFGEMACLDDKPRSASVLAMSDVEYAVMRVGDFLACVEGSPAAGQRW
jgi:CRP-like cAMP-binding protein